MTTKTAFEVHEACRILQERIKHKHCINCRQQPRIAWVNNTWALRCACGVDKAVLNSRNRLAERVNQHMTMAKTDIASLAVQDVKALLNVGKATDKEIAVFVRFCTASQANPWTREVYLIKYAEGQPASIVLGLEFYLKRASRNPLYLSYESGVIVERAGSYVELPGSMTFPKDMLIGGWCKVYKKDAPVPFYRTVSMTEYDKHQAQWKTMPATMIEKVAIAQAVRRAFPEEFGPVAEIEAEARVIMEGEAELPSNGHPALPANSEARNTEEKAQPPESTERATEPAQTQEPPALKTLGDLYTAGRRIGYQTKKDMLAAIGVADDTLIGADLDAAFQKLQEHRP